MGAVQQGEFDKLLADHFPDIHERGLAREFMRMSADQRALWLFAEMAGVKRTLERRYAWRQVVPSLVTPAGLIALVGALLTGRFPAG